jgi:hypothetical protein
MIRHGGVVRGLASAKLTQTVVNRAKTEKGKDDARARYKDGEVKAITSVVLIYRSRKQ